MRSLSPVITQRLRRVCERRASTFDPVFRASYIEGFWLGVHAQLSETEPPGEAFLPYFCGCLDGSLSASSVIAA